MVPDGTVEHPLDEEKGVDGELMLRLTQKHKLQAPDHIRHLEPVGDDEVIQVRTFFQSCLFLVCFYDVRNNRLFQVTVALLMPL
jgi:hypothetical protein